MSEILPGADRIWHHGDFENVCMYDLRDRQTLGLVFLKNSYIVLQTAANNFCSFKFLMLCGISFGYPVVLCIANSL